MITYKINMYLGLKCGWIENKFAILHSTTFIESEKELTEDEIIDNYYDKVKSYPRTHYLEITKEEMK